MILRPGTRLKSVTDETELIVVRAPGQDVDIRCGGHPLLAVGDWSPDAKQELETAHTGGTLLGKRYADAGGSLELLCTHAGEGSLSIGDVALDKQDAKELPSSD